MRKVYCLSTCSTWHRILKDLDGLPGFEQQNIKENNITGEQLDWLRSKTGSYEALFSKQAMKYKELGLKDKNLTEADFRQLILEEYTFLKRPVIIDGDTVYVGNAPKTVNAAKEQIRFVV